MSVVLKPPPSGAFRLMQIDELEQETDLLIEQGEAQALGELEEERERRKSKNSTNTQADDESVWTPKRKIKPSDTRRPLPLADVKGFGGVVGRPAKPGESTRTGFDSKSPHKVQARGGGGRGSAQKGPRRM